MAALPIAIIILGIHVLFARIYVYKLSNYIFYLGIGLLEGIPLFISALLLLLNVDYAFAVLLFALLIYIIMGALIKIWFEQYYKNENITKWKEWENIRKNVNPWKRFFLLFL